MARAIPRGEDPQKVSDMPVFKYTESDKMSSKRRKLVYSWGYCGGGALGRLGLVKRTKLVGLPTPPPIEERTSPTKLGFVDIQTNVIDISAGFGFTVIDFF